MYQCYCSVNFCLLPTCTHTYDIRLPEIFFSINRLFRCFIEPASTIFRLLATLDLTRLNQIYKLRRRSNPRRHIVFFLRIFVFHTRSPNVFILFLVSRQIYILFFNSGFGCDFSRSTDDPRGLLGCIPT